MPSPKDTPVPRFTPSGNPPAGLPQHVAVGEGRTAVSLDLIFQGPDLLLTVTGGRAHVGATAVCAPPTADHPDPAPQIEAVGPHKEGPLAGDCARRLAAAAGRTCAVVAGVHQDDITSEEIAAVLANVRAGTDVLAAWLGGGAVAAVGPDPETLMGRWCREAAPIALSWFRRTGDLEYKDGREVVTAADREIETLLRERIAAAFPDDLIVGEEFGGQAGAAATDQRVWQIDPVDGTLNFARGLPGFCISLALMQGTDVLAAAVCQPVSGDLFTATAGRGARLNGVAMAVSECCSLGEAVLSTQLKKQGRIMSDPDLLQRVGRVPHKTRRTGAIALEMAWVAAGFHDGLIGSFVGAVPLWDIGAGLLLIAEAGGRITDHAGQPYVPGGPDLVATGGVFHPELIDLLTR